MSGYDFPRYDCVVCGKEATHRVIGHREVRGEVCNAHIPKDYSDFAVFALDD